MRIENNNLPGIRPPAPDESKQVRAAGEQSSGLTSSGSAGASGDEVQLSNVAGRVSAGQLGQPESVPGDRSARIDQLTKLVQSGQYNPDPEKIADSMIRDMISGAGSS